MVLCWIAVILAAPRQEPSELVHGIALFGHLMSVVVGFGAVLLVDWFGLLWLTGRRPLTDVLRTARGAHVPTWLGFAGLLATGLFLGPPVAPKAVAVLVVGINGVYAARLLPELSRWPDPPVRPLVRAVAATGVSQLAWWTAVILGFLNTRS
ncbi:hypothetical protein [Paractinoplanes toevensis]|uniref:Uncharacterized protein n=1 Tax=Paractinoplanes toevensis TaxID=571911 RepID=A0A919WAP0_9ACTN|nr:hypothetical protein [Actinoplanes toevensis]GIM96608.1 hypothetical protein Ato02nite_084010 [Actinoplanes toevensis]